MSVNIYRKLATDPDTSYSLVSSVPDGTSELLVETLSSLTEYTFKAIINADEATADVANATTFSILDTDYQAVIDRAIALGYGLPTKRQQFYENQLVLDLKVNGIWSLLDVFYCFATNGDSDFATLNWKNPLLYQATKNGALNYAFGQGFIGNGIDAYLSTAFVPKTHGVNYSLNDASFGGYAGRNKAQSVHFISSYNTGPMGIGIVTRGNANHLGWRINASTSGDVFNSGDNNSIAFWHIQRTSDAVNKVFKNGIVATTGVQSSIDLPSQPLTLLAANVNGVISAYDDQAIKMSWAGGSLNGKEKVFNDIWNKYIANTGKSILSQTSHCWFTRDIAVYNATANKTFIGQVHNKDNQGYASTIVQIDHVNNDAVSTFRLASISQFDDHNEPSILIKSSDSKLFTCYAEHSGVAVRYRTSTNILDATSFGAEAAINPGGGKYSYVSCFEDAAGQIWLFFRDDNLDNTLLRGWSYMKSSDGGVTFTGYKTFFYGDVSRGYLTFAQDPNNKNLIHFVASGGHPVDTGAVDIFHFYFNCSLETLHKSDGTDVTVNAPLNASSMTLVMNNNLPDTGWFEDIAVDSAGNPRVLITNLPSGKNNSYVNKDLYYSEWNGISWTVPYLIHRSLSRNIKSASATGSSPGDITQYPPNSTFDKLNPDIIYAAKEVNGICEMFKLKRKSASSFSSQQKTFNSLNDYWRPQAINNSINNVMFLSKVFYPGYINYDQQLIIATL